MNQLGRSWESELDDTAADDAPDPWFRPVWEDSDDVESTPPGVRPSTLPRAAAPARRDADELLGPLAAASAALARLEAMAEMASEPVRDGLIARLAYAEAAGRLAAQGLTAHPVDLALRDHERIGRRDLWVRHRAGRTRRSVPDWEPEDAWLLADENITAALALARLLKRLPAADNPLLSVERAQAWLGPLAPQAGPFDARRFARWREAHLPDGRRRDDRPALLRAAEAAAAWMEGGVSDIPDAAQALAVTALVLRRTGFLLSVPLPLWAGWRGLCAPDEPAALPRLRGDVAARLAPGGAPWEVVFLRMAADAARAGLRTLAALRQAEVAGVALAAGQDKRSRLPAALDHLLRQAAVTAPALARSLEVTPQAALRLLGQLVTAGVVSEITGRKSFRAFALAVRSSVQRKA